MDHQQLAQPGDLAFVRAHDLVGRAICALSQGVYSHVKVVANAGQCVEAVPPRVRIAPLQGDEDVVCLPYASWAERQAAVRHVTVFCGHPYSFLSYLSDLLWFADCPLELQWRGSLNCAQLAARVGFGFDQMDVTPSSLYAAALAAALEVPCGAH